MSPRRCGPNCFSATLSVSARRLLRLLRLSRLHLLLLWLLCAFQPLPPRPPVVDLYPCEFADRRVVPERLPEALALAEQLEVVQRLRVVDELAVRGRPEIGEVGEVRLEGRRGEEGLLC